jgi:hypothetical protein
LDQAGGEDAGVGDEHGVRLSGEPSERVVLAADHRPTPAGHHHATAQGAPEVRVGEHPLGLGGCHKRTKAEATGGSAIAIRFRGS